MAEQFTYDLFVSYAEADRAWVEGYLLDALEKAEVRCTCESAFTLGVPRILEFERAIRQSRYTLLVISEAYLADDLTRFTDILAQSYGEQVGTWPVIPLTLQEGLQLPPRLKILEGLQASTSEEWEAAIERLCNQLKRPLPPPSPKPACPYPGMIPFSENDGGRFFGRDGEIEELLGRLRLHPFLTVIGPSGSGKSSLVFAGLIPKLKQSGLFGTGQWCIRSLRPGTSPLTNLQAVLGGDATNLEARIQQLLSTQPDTRRLLLVVDQFEELFTQGGVEAASFQQALLKLMEMPNVYVILTVRADFYPDLMGSLLWEKIRSHRFEVLPLNEQGLKQAIVRPAEGVEVYVDPVLVERLVVDAKGEPGVLPLIQETLVLLWEKLERHYLPLKAYELLLLPRPAYGGTANQPRTGLQVAIARRADTALADLETEEKQAIAQRIFLRLIQFGEGRPGTRRQQLQRDLHSTDDSPELFNQTIEHLAQCRLLTFSGEENAPEKLARKVDLAHEALISGWPTLQQWIIERREAEQVRRRLETQAQEWERLGQGIGGLLDSIELAGAERWLKSPDAEELGYSLSLADLITASQQAIQEAARLEEERQQRELTLIQEKLEQEKRSRKAEQIRNRVIIGSLGVILALGTIAGTFTWQQQRQTLRTRQAFYDLSLNIPVSTPELISMLPEFLKEAKKLSQQGGKEAERAIAYYGQILTQIKKLQKESQKLSPQEQETINKIAQEAKPSLIALIINLEIPILEKQLGQKNIGKRISNIYANLDQQFTDALQTTYKILMLDTGADVNRNGQLDSTDEVKSIPCDILQKVQDAWQYATQGRCGFYGENDVFSASSTCQKELGGQNLTITLFPIESLYLFDKHLQACKINSTQ
jgi:hypothetical protein